MSERAFRSVLPHEPLPRDDLGYIYIQGAFEPRKSSKKDDNGPQNDCACYWTKAGLEKELKRVLASDDIKSICNLPYGNDLISVEVLEDASSPPYTKARICYCSPRAALQVCQASRQQKIAPSHLFQGRSLQFTSRPFQTTLLTLCPVLPSEIAWPKSNPPKFRRLLGRPGEPIEELQQERQATRYVFMAGLVDMVTQDDEELEQSWWSNPRYVSEAIRKVANPYDTTGKGVEVFVSNKKKTTHFCHIGMRKPEDAKTLVMALQDKVVKWELDWNDVKESQLGFTDRVVRSENLFLDFAAVTKRSNAKAEARGNGDSGIFRGEPSRSECTSKTGDVVVPGLVLIEDFISEEEEDTLIAVLTGPAAPWAPAQKNFSKSGDVKRKVQHYGYVFDYETANVLRDRSKPAADCPPMPGLPPNTCHDGDLSDTDLVSHLQNSVQEGQGWNTLAFILERVRRMEFTVPGENTEGAPHCYPGINQLTVNFYEPGEGIGSHVDTPSAFGDGLISISLHGGVVMEFRNHNSVDDVKKLVYLPSRSLLLMSGPSRYEWEHTIVTRMTDTVDGKIIPRTRRISLTLRTAIGLSGKPMPLVTTRSFPPKWGCHVPDAENRKGAFVTPALERENVHAFYDAVALQWHHTRGKRGVLWPGATQFLTQLPPGSIVADVGCGDGKYFPAIWEAGSFVLGSDISLPLLQQSANGSEENLSQPDSRRISGHRQHFRKHPAVTVADCMNVPLRDKRCDAAICIALMHHLSTRERRIRCISELGRIVKVGGLINIQAWALDQQQDSRRKFAGTDVFVPFNAQPKYLDKKANGNDARIEGTDIPIAHNKSLAQVYSEAYNADFDEKKGLVVFQRYCHLYRKGELEELASEVDSVRVHETGYETGNYFVILKVVK